MKLSKVLQLLAVSLALAAYAAWVQYSREETPPASSGKEIPAAGIPLLRLPEAEVLWRKGTALFVDVRSSNDYEFGHIPGAIHFPEGEFEQRFPTLEDRLRRARAIVVYCKSRDCGASLWMALRLRNAGLIQTKIYPGGWNEWYLDRLPTTIRTQ